MYTDRAAFGVVRGRAAASLPKAGAIAAGDARCTPEHEGLYRRRSEAIAPVFADAGQKPAMRDTQSGGLPQSAKW